MPNKKKRAPLHIAPGAGRAYEMGPLRAVFKADGNETRRQYSISEWWLDPYTRGPGAHKHEEDDVFYMLEGTMSFCVDGKWFDAPKGSLVIAPGGIPHDFENRTAMPAGFLNISVPGDFEPAMAGIAEWFRARSPADSHTANAPQPAPSSNDDRWWNLIERSRKGAKDNEAQADRLIKLLSTELSAAEIITFDTFLQERVRDAFRSDLWAVAYIMNGGCSDDGFDYFLGWLICKGKAHYEAALANPEQAAKGVRPDDEPFENEVVYYGPSRAWAIKTGKPIDEYYKIAPAVPRTLQGELFDEDTVENAYPKLAKKFGG
ncbi:MAG TPA: DUF4240 domain-containing protein [Polyangium sp.]|nr:DUF4240 domain-containing protein [Polyangium sp.]